MKIERVYGTEVSPPTHLGSQTPRLVHSAIEFNRDKQRNSARKETERDVDPEAPNEDIDSAEVSQESKSEKPAEGHLNIIA